MESYSGSGSGSDESSSSSQIVCEKDENKSNKEENGCEMKPEIIRVIRVFISDWGKVTKYIYSVSKHKCDTHDISVMKVVLYTPSHFSDSFSFFLNESVYKMKPFGFYHYKFK